jgi:hypothetical protein
MIDISLIAGPRALIRVSRHKFVLLSVAVLICYGAPVSIAEGETGNKDLADSQALLKDAPETTDNYKLVYTVEVKGDLSGLPIEALSRHPSAAAATNAVARIESMLAAHDNNGFAIRADTTEQRITVFVMSPPICSQPEHCPATAVGSNDPGQDTSQTPLGSWVAESKDLTTSDDAYDKIHARQAALLDLINEDPSNEDESGMRNDDLWAMHSQQFEAEQNHRTEARMTSMAEDRYRSSLGSVHRRQHREHLLSSKQHREHLDDATTSTMLRYQWAEQIDNYVLNKSMPGYLKALDGADVQSLDSLHRQQTMAYRSNQRSPTQD